MSQTAKTIVLWALLILVFYLIYTIVSASSGDEQTVSFSALLDRIEADELAGVELEIRDGETFHWQTEAGRFTADGVLTDSVIGLMRDHGVVFSVRHGSGSDLWSLASSWLPLLLAFLFLYYLLRHLSARRTGGGFGQARGTRRTPPRG